MSEFSQNGLISTLHDFGTRSTDEIGGLFVGIFIKTLSFQRMTKESTELVGATVARISRYERMEAHARTEDVRLKKYGYSN